MYSLVALPGLLRVLALLLLGAALTVGTAWGLPFLTNFEVTSYSPEQGWAAQETYSYLRLEEFAYRMGPFDALAHRVSIKWDDTYSSATRADVVGWPFPCLTARWSVETENLNGILRPGATRMMNLSGGIRLRDDIRSGPPFGVWSVRSLPLGIDAVPFLKNTLFYAVLSALLLLAVALRAHLIRRKRRAKRLCAHCTYDLRGSGESRCPECGRDPGIAEKWLVIKSRTVWLLAALAWLTVGSVGGYYWWQSSVL